MRLFLGILVFTVWAAICRYGYVCEIKNHCNQILTPVETPRFQSLDLILDDSIVFLENYDQFLYPDGLTTPVLNKNNTIYLDSLAGVMKSDTSVFLTITGMYRPSEQGEAAGMFENIGMARADAARKLISERGIPEDKISLDADAGTVENLPEPVSFYLYTVNDETAEDYAKIQYTFTNMTFSDANFEKDSPVFNPGESLILYADSVKTYLDLNPDKTLVIIGHCDKDGTDEYNMELGKNRAENAKKYFEELGVTATIKTVSKGKTEPAFPNDSETNMQKNRRVNFVIE